MCICICFDNISFLFAVEHDKQGLSICWGWQNVSRHVSCWHQPVKSTEIQKFIHSQRLVYFLFHILFIAVHNECPRTDMIFHHTIILSRRTGEMSTPWDHDHVMMRESVWLKLWCTHTRIRTMCQFVLLGFLIPLGHVCTRMMAVLWGKNYNA